MAEIGATTTHSPGLKAEEQQLRFSNTLKAQRTPENASRAGRALSHWRCKQRTVY
jgi:hypothetical protein